MPIDIGTLRGTLLLGFEDFVSGLDKAAAKLASFATKSATILNKEVGSLKPPKFNREWIGAAAIGASFAVAVKKVYNNVSEAQQALAQLEAGVKSTGGAAGRSAEQLVEMSGSLQKLTGVSDEAIQRGQAVLLTFTKIGRDAFPGAIQASLDLSRRLGTDLSSAALQVGKALNDPIKGVTALSRAGVQFTESQKDTIKALTESGRLIEAQTIVLRELELQVGGSAEAFRNTLPGAIASLSNSWGDLLEEVGKSGEGGGLFRTGIEGMVSSLDYLKENWFALESAVFAVLGTTSSALVKWGALAVGVVEKFAIAQQSIQNLVPDFLGFGLAGKAQGLADRAVSTLGQTKKDLLQLAEDLKSGFGDKAEAALERGIAPAKGLDSALNGLADTVGELSGDAIKLANELADVSAELVRSAAFSRKLAAAFNLSASKEQIDSIKRSHTLHEAYLKDVEKFGKSAAASLQLLRAADYDAEVAAEAAKETYERLGEAVAEAGRLAGEGFSERLRDQVRAGLEGMERDAQEILRLLDLRQQLADEAEFAVRISAIDEVSPHLARIQENYLHFIRELGQGSVEEGEQILSSMGESFSAVVDGILTDLASIEDAAELSRISGKSRSSRSVFDAQVKRLNELAEKYPEKAADAQAEINDRTQQFWSEQLSAWSGALGFLADRFGGFFNYLNDLVSGLQQAQQFGSSVSSIASSAGAASSTASAFGAVAGTAAVFAIVYDIVDKAIKASKTRKYGTEVEFGLVDQREGTSHFNETGKAVIKSIRDLIAGIEDALSISIEDLAEIGVKVRNDGERFKAYFKGELLGTYGTLDEALQEAVGTALRDASTTIRGLSDLMAQGLEEFTNPDFGELMDFLGQLREISDLSLPQGAIEVRDLTKHLDDLWSTLNRVRIATPALAQGFENLVTREIQMWQSWIDSITGRERTNAEILEDRKRELIILKAEIALRQIGLKQRKAEVDATILALRAGTLLIGGGPGPGAGNTGGGGRGGIIGITQAFIAAGSAITQTAAIVMTATAGLSQAALDMIALLELESSALGELIDALAGLELPDAASLRLPRGSGGGGSSDLDNVRQFIEDKTFELAARGMSDYAASVAELMRQYDVLLEQAGRDITQRTALIDLREQELALMRQEQIQSTVAAFRDFLGLINPFDQIRQTAEDLIKQIEASPFGDARKARMIGRVMAELEEQLQRLSREMTTDLLGSLIGDLEHFGADEKLLSETRRQLAIIEHVLRMEHYRTEIAILRAQGFLTEEVLKILEDGIKFLSTIDPTKFLEGAGTAVKPLRGKELADAIARDKAMVAGTTGATEAAKDLADALKRAADLLQKYHDDALDPLTRDLVRITGDFKAIREAFGDTSDIMKLYASAVETAIDNFLDPIRQTQQQLFFGDESPFDVMAQWQQAQLDLAKAQTAFRAGDLSVVESIPDLVQRFIGIAREITPIGSQAYKTIFTEANRFLNEVLALSPDDIGSINAPMSVAGMADVVALSEAQLDVLDRIYNSSQRVAAAVESLNTKLNRTNALQNQA